MEEPWWKEGLAADIHQSLRAKELQLPVYKGRSPQIGMRRYFVELLSIFSDHCHLCPTARHLAVYLLDLCMDRYDIPVKQLHTVSLTCLLLASKFEEREDKVPQLEHLNNLAYACNVNVVLTKEDLQRMEVLLLKSFDWNLCLPTPAHYIGYYLCASIGQNDLHYGCPIASVTKIKDFLEKYVYYFLDLSVQDYAFLHFRPSLIAAACVCASRICMQISPAWTARLELLTCYSWEHLAPCVEMMLMYYGNDIQQASTIRKQVTGQRGEQEAVGNVSYPVTAGALFQQPSYHPCAHHSAALYLFQSPGQDLCSAYRNSLQASRPGGLAGSAAGSLHSCAAVQGGLWAAEQVALGTEPRHCMAVADGSSYFSGHPSCAAGCFDV